MHRVVPMAVLACLGVLALGPYPAAAQSRQGPMVTTEPEPLVQGETQQTRTHVRARPKIRVRPRYPYRRYHSIYPLPYEYEYPGPNAVRHCSARYVTEHRPSGTVIVPRMRCWWARG